MARLWSYGAELNTTTEGVEVDSLTGTGSIVTSPVRSGTYAFRSNPSAGTGYLLYTYGAAAFTGKTYLRFYLYIASYTDALDQICALRDSAGVALGSIRLNSTGTLELWDDAGTVQLGSDSSALALNVWYRIELFADNDGTTGTALTAKIDGTQFATGTHSPSAGAVANQVRIGAATTTTCDIYFDDVAINDASGSFQNSYPGAGQIIHLRPNAAGDNAAWTIQTAEANNYQTVDEVTPDDSTSRVASTTLNETDDHNLDATPSSLAKDDTINCVQVGVRYSATSTVLVPSFVLRIKSAASGTVEESGNITPNATSYVTNATASPRNYSLTLYDLPGASSTAWSKATLDTAQIGYRISVDDTVSVNISTVWLLVDYAKVTTDIPVVSGLYLHLDATKQVYSDAGSTAATDGGAVHQWNDLIYGNHAIQATGTNQPLYRTSGINSIASIDFDGTDNIMATGNTTWGVFTAFLVIKMAGTAGMLLERGSGAEGDYLYGTTGNTVQVARGATTSAKNYSANWAVDDTTQVIARRFTGTHTSNRMWINGTEVTLTGGSGDPGTGTYTNTLQIGARNTSSLPSNGYIGELIVYTRELSDAELTDVNDYLIAKWIPATAGTGRLLLLGVGS